ncbi:hypothetical protein O6H91_13G083900 [Diphasiastrum complanatum]|uniref:Uncharacterized protein n=1 Tax=Diphasiastrum complanatum TaxID=34168 RepID=A0ACC2BWN4_DIPCM|nr:hypothetical protein O6H91_13G083900 [Diphasiastrum complanatum]
MSASCSPVTVHEGSQEALLSTFQKRPIDSTCETSEETGTEDGADDCGYRVDKKRRLSVEQVKALEVSFELESKLEPERKLQLARELELQPKQVAIWFQNRRARLKTKQLGIDYDILREGYKLLKADFDTLLQERRKLQAQVMELNEKLHQQHENILKLDGKKIVVAPLEKPETYVRLGSGVETITTKTDIPLEDGGMSDLHSLSLCKLSLEVKHDQGSLKSDIDGSDVLDVDTPTNAGSTQNTPSRMQHQNCSEILTLAGGFDAGLSHLAEDLYAGRVHSPFPYQRAPIKLLEDTGGTEENCNCFLTIEDQQAGAFFCWDSY